MVGALDAPAAHDVVTLFHFFDEAGDFGGFVLKIPVHGNDNLASGMVEGSLQRGRLAEVAAQANDRNALVVIGDFRKYTEGAVTAAVIHKDNFVRFAHSIHHIDDFDVERRSTFLLVVEGHNDGIYRRTFFPAHRANLGSISIGPSLRQVFLAAATLLRKRSAPRVDIRVR